MAHQVTGPMDPVAFLNEFLPLGPSSDGINQDGTPITLSNIDFPSVPSSSRNEEKRQWVDVINNSGVCSWLRFYATKDKRVSTDGDLNNSDDSDDYSDDHNDVYRGPDVVAYREPPGGSDKPQGVFVKAVFIVEFKEDSQDFFDDEKGVTMSDQGRYTLSQITAHSMKQAWTQPLTHIFSIVRFPNHVRLLRWDRAGVIVTRRFEWRDGEMLSNFLRRFEKLPAEQRGLDSSTRLTNESETEAKAARKAMANAGYKHLARGPWYTYTVYNDAMGSRKQDSITFVARRFIVGRPLFYPKYTFTGRSTLGFIAWDIERKKLVYLKDTWRKVESDIQEGDVYTKLNSSKEPEKSVPHIPTRICAGDVYGSDPPSELPQQTQAHKYASSDWVRSRDGERPREVGHYTHYRLVLDEIARPLSTFRSLKELVTALLDALNAHEAAYKNHRVLHRDISEGNILITDDGRGLLIDWDLAHDEILGKLSDRRWRTGTWFFLSVANLGRASTHMPRDDLESLLWVLLYTVLRYHPCERLDKDQVKYYMEEIFEEYRPPRGTNPAFGGTHKRLFIKDASLSSKPRRIWLTSDFIKYFPKAIEELIRSLARVFKLVIELGISEEPTTSEDTTADAVQVYDLVCIPFAHALNELGSEDADELLPSPVKKRFKCGLRLSPSTNCSRASGQLSTRDAQDSSTLD